MKAAERSLDWSKLSIHSGTAIPIRMSAILLAGVFLVGPAFAAAKEAPFQKKTYTYKTVDSTKIEADVYRADDDVIRPVVVWIHGGALIFGGRSDLPKNLLELCRTEGYALVAIDYRLAPQVKVPAIIDDVKDAFRWLRDQRATLHIDPDRLVVAGGSAGGYLTMMTGICVKPRPKALVAYYGYGELDGAWLTTPSEHYRKAGRQFSKEEAYKGIGDKVVSCADGPSGIGGPRVHFYQYLRQNGLWSKVVTGFDPATERAKIDPFCPVRNITADYPPILMVHGTADTDVPYEKSADMDKELTAHQVVHELITCPGAEHGLGGGDQKQVAAAHEKALAFIREHLKK